MLTLEDCIALSDLTREEAAFDEQEHLPGMIATELCSYLLQSSRGHRAIKTILCEDIAHARARGDYCRSAKLKLLLRHVIEQTPRVDLHQC